MAEVPVFVPPPICAPEHRRHILWAAVLASSMGFIDSTVTAIAMPAIRASFGAGLAAAQWVNASYLLTLTALLLTGGAMGDRFGTARVFVTGIVLFVLSSLICAAAPTIGLLIAARAVQGAAAAFMVPGAMAMIGRAYPREERGRALGFWTAAATASTAGGPILGGLMLTLEGDWAWRLIFAINLPLGLAALWLLLPRLARDPGRPGTAIDFAGAVLATSGLGLVAWALTEGQIWPFVAGSLLLAAFIGWERIAPAPMLRLGLFRNLSFSAINLATLLLYTAISGVSFYLPMYGVPALGLSPLEMALSFLPISVLITALATPFGHWADRIGPGPFMVAGATLVAIAQAAQALTIHWQAHWSVTVPLIALTGLGVAVLIAPLTAAVMHGAGDGEQGAASGINNMVARAGGLVAVALLGGIAALGYGPVSAASPGYGLASASAAHLQASATGFAAVAWVCAAASAGSAALSLLIRRAS